MARAALSASSTVVCVQDPVEPHVDLGYVRRRGVPRGSDVAGVITKEHVADSVADSVKAYPQ
jgi:hypothetical protein